jgi:hypothetical protein
VPQFAELSFDKVEEFRASLARAADDGIAAAAAMHGAWLFDTKHDRDRGSKLITMAYKAEDPWGLGLGIRAMSAHGERFSDAAIAGVERLAHQGFPLAYGTLAAQEMQRISDNRASYSLEKQTMRRLCGS